FGSISTVPIAIIGPKSRNRSRKYGLKNHASSSTATTTVTDDVTKIFLTFILRVTDRGSLAARHAQVPTLYLIKRAIGYQSASADCKFQRPGTDPAMPKMFREDPYVNYKKTRKLYVIDRLQRAAA